LNAGGDERVEPGDDRDENWGDAWADEADEADRTDPADQGDERVGDGVEHLQAAAREMIAAARTFLDVAEDVVGDHVVVSSLAEVLGTMGQAVVRAGNRARDAAGSPGSRHPGPGGDDGDDGSRVQHIDVS